MDGSITVYTGPMFSGKSAMLTARLQSRQRARREVLCVKPQIDSRYSSHEIVAKRRREDCTKFEPAQKFPAQPIRDEQEFSDFFLGHPCQVVGIDEAQFFGLWLPQYLVQMRNSGAEIYVAGLDLDAWRNPFGCMPHVLAVADVVQKFTADCFQCGQPARYTQKIGGSGAQVQVGAEDLYEARCEKFWTVPV